MKKRSVWALMTVLALSLLGCAMSIGKVKFPSPSTTSQPRDILNASQERAWAAVKHALEGERIGIASSDKSEGSITTEYIQGETQLLAMGLMGSISTRYKYAIALEKTASNETKVRVQATLESMSAGLSWHDVSKDNPQIISSLERWLQEKIEKAL